VHHGGSGTSGFAFSSGVPSLTIPFGFDQYYWGARAMALGVSPQYLPFKDLDSAVLAERIQAVISDHEMALQAREMSRKLGTENGVAKAVEIILRLTGDGAS
jgi:UDP:flavonoid glycosyltransferase YjiC (YdhE family)